MNLEMVILIHYFVIKKGVYPYKYMDDWEKLNETPLLEKISLQQHKYGREDITDVDNRYAKRVSTFKYFNNKNLGDYHDLYLQSDTLLLADVLENFKK